MIQRVSLVVLLALCVVSCGGTVDSNTSPSGSGGASGAGGAGATAGTAGSGASGGLAGSAGTSGGAGGAGGKNSGDCDSDADCAPGKCIELTPGGYRVCRMPVLEATECQNPGNPGIDECCNSSQCAKGKCYAFPATSYCGGAEPMPHNVCASDGCELGAWCPVGNETTGVCIPGGVFGFKVAGCKLSNCDQDTDCGASPGGVCVPIEDPCCLTPQGLFCVYPGDGCRKQSDCKSTQSCVVEFDPVRGQNVAHCKDGVQSCPA